MPLSTTTPLRTGAIASSGIVLQPEIPICQTDLPLDWYQSEFKPYAEEYLALPDRKPATVLPWIDRYALPRARPLRPFAAPARALLHGRRDREARRALRRQGRRLVPARAAGRAQPEKSIIVESAVHFMAETIATLARPDQQVWITNPKAGCTMEMLAKEYMVAPVVDQLARALRRRPRRRRLHEHLRAREGARRPHGRRGLHQLERAPRASSWSAPERKKRASSSPTSTSAATPPLRLGIAPRADRRAARSPERWRIFVLAARPARRSRLARLAHA